MHRKSSKHGHGRGGEHNIDAVRRSRIPRRGGLTAAGRALQLAALKAQLRGLEGQAAAGQSDPELEQRMAHLQDVIAFESVEEGPTLFEGLQERGLTLEPPEQLTDAQCAERAIQITDELAEVGVFLFGHEYMQPREFYSTLWHRTLREGCYLKQRKSPVSVVMVDVSRRIPREVMESFIEFLQGSRQVQ